MTLLVGNDTHAYVIYDWITLDTNIYDSGYIIKAEWIINDDEFKSKKFSTLNIGNKVIGYIEGNLNNGYGFQIELDYYYGNNFYGTLTQDGKYIEAIYNYEQGVGTTLYDVNLNSSLYMSPSKAWGSLDYGMYFPLLGYVPLNDPLGSGFIDKSGRWQLREEAVSVVPEPSTLLLLLSGLGSLVFYFSKCCA